MVQTSRRFERHLSVETAAHEPNHGFCWRIASGVTPPVRILARTLTRRISSMSSAGSGSIGISANNSKLSRTSDAACSISLTLDNVVTDHRSSMIRPVERTSTRHIGVDVRQLLASPPASTRLQRRRSLTSGGHQLVESRDRNDEPARASTPLGHGGKTHSCDGAGYMSRTHM